MIGPTPMNGDNSSAPRDHAMNLFDRKPRRQSPDLDAPVTPPASSSRDAQKLQKRIGRSNHGRLVEWLLRGGWVFAALVLLILVFGGIFIGFPVTGELLLGVTSPNDPRASIGVSALRWLLSVIGWLAIPVIAASLVGYFVTARIDSFRGLSPEQVANGEGANE